MNETAPRDGVEEPVSRPVELTANSHAQMERFRVAHQTQVLTLLLSDLEGSTKLQSEVGNVRSAEIVRLHRDLFRRTLAGMEGGEVETAGDSFLAVFATPSEGVKFSLRMQAAMRRARETEPRLPLVRVGIHQGQVVVERHADGPKAVDIYGLQVSTAARIMDLARGGQVLCSRAVFDDARAILRGDDLAGLRPVAWRNHGPYRFKGVEDAYDVCEVGEEGLAPLEAPPAGTKGWPAGAGAEELGWRPAAGGTVPGTNWVLEERLGLEGGDGGGPRTFRGEFGEVWKARNPGDKSRQVFKFCFKRDRVPALKREARLLKRLAKYRHPNLVDVYDVTEGDHPPYYLEMEYVEGPSLDAWLAGNPPLRDRLEVVAQVADALDTVHAAGICHRDIKPSNLLLTRREDGALQAKLTDFGLGAAEDPDLLRSIQVSRSEGITGTWDYIAPEVRTSGRASPQSDLYSLGVTLYQVVAGDLRRTLGDWESHVDSEVLRGIIRRCIVTDPAQRWARAAELAQALRSHDERVERLRLEREREERRRRSRAARRVAALVLVAAAAAAAGLYAWWRMPGVLELDVRPAGARIEIAGRILTAADKPVPLSLRPGGYEVRVSLDDHDPETREVLVARNQTKPFAVALRHHQGRLDADGEPLGSEIQVDGVSYGSRIRNLALETGPHRLLAWAFDGFDRERTIRLARGQQARERLWLDRGRMWTHRAPSIQGGACLVADVDGDGIPDFAQNDIQEIAIHSSATGEVLARIPAPASGSRTFTTLELGGPVGTVIATAKEYGIASGVPSPLEVFLVRTAAPTRLLWRRSIVTGPWKTPSGASILAVGDWNGDGVAEIAVSSRNGRATVLNGATGETIRDAAVTEGETEYPPGLTTLGAREPGCVCFAGSPPGAPSAEGRATVVGCVNLRDGAALWRKDLGIVRGTLARDLDGDGVSEILVWTETGWFALDGRTGQARWTNTLPGGKRMPPYPWLADLDGDGRLEFVWASGSEPDTLLALRLDDGRVAWEGPAGARFDSIQLPDGLLPRAPRGEILLPVGPGLAAVDPRSGRVAWSAPGVPMGLLVADVDQDGTAEILETISGVGLVCLDAEGRTRWTLRLNLDVRPYMLMPDVDGDGSREILIHRHAALYGLVRAPRTLWQQQAVAPLQATPLVVNAGPGGRPVIIQSGSWDNGETLRGFDPDSGAVRWGTKCLFQANRALAVADWDGDGRPDVAAIGQWPRPGGRYEQALVVLRADDGHVVRSIPMPDAGSIYSIPAVADLNGDGVNDFATHRWDRQDVVAVDGKTGDVMWTHPTKSPNMGGVAAADLDGDGLPDVVAPSLDGHVYALRGKDGTPLWAPVRTGPGSRSPPLLHDVTGDGVPDVLVVAQNGVLHVIDGRRGTVAWTAAAEGASEGLGHPVVARSGGGPVLVLAPLGGAGVVAFDAATRAVVWQAPADRVVLASPVVADLDRDGALEVVAATADGAVFVLDLATGRELWRVQAGSQPIEADPAVADLDGDGVLDILIACHDFTLTAISGRATGSARKRLAAQKQAPR